MDITVNGHKTRVATGGYAPKAGAPAIILIHGAGMDSSNWAFQTRYLGRHGIAAYAPDLPGHGDSAGTALTSVPAIAGWIFDLMDALGVARATLAGHSMGSLIALEAAALAPDRVTGIQLLGTSASMPVHPDLIAAAVANDPLAGNLVTDWAFGSQAHKGGHPSGLFVMGGGQALLATCPPDVLGIDLKACNAWTGAAAAMAGITAPATLILGDEDKMTPPRNARALAEGLKGSRTVVIPDCGHMMMIEKPFETTRAMYAALALPVEV